MDGGAHEEAGLDAFVGAYDAQPEADRLLTKGRGPCGGIEMRNLERQMELVW